MRVKIFCVDTYQCQPLSDFSTSDYTISKKRVGKVPVIRIFGISESGQKCCLHVHNAFPYILVPCPSENSDIVELFATELDSAIGNGASYSSFVYDVKIISAFPMYGYYQSPQQFYKILFLNPAAVKKAADVLVSGKVMGHCFQPHEAHLPYHLQFLINQNLFGMDWMCLRRARFRQGSWCSDIQDSVNFLLGDVQRKSCCVVECDVDAKDIDNQYATFGEASVSSLSALWEDERLRRINHGMSADDVKLPDSPEGRDFQTGEREKALLAKFAIITEKMRQIASEAIDDGMTQLLEGIVSGADSFQQSDANQTPVLEFSQRQVDFSQRSMTQVLENIVNQAGVESFRENEDLLQLDNSENSQSDGAEDGDDPVEPGSILSYSQDAENENEEETLEDVDINEELQDVDWQAFIAEDDISLTPQQMPPQLDGTNDKASKRPPSGQQDGAQSPTKRNRKDSDIPSTSGKTSRLRLRSNEAPSPITVSSSSSSVIITDAVSVDEMHGKFEVGFNLPSDQRRDFDVREGEATDTLAAIAPTSPMSEVGTSSVYSFQSSSAFIPLSGDGESLPSPSSPTSDVSVKIVGWTPSQKSGRDSSRMTPRNLDQTSIQFFHDDMTPFPTNETEFFTRKTTLKPNRKPPSRLQVSRWQRSSKRESASAESVIVEEEDIEESFFLPSQKRPACTSTPHPNKLLISSQQTPLLSSQMTDTTVSSPFGRSVTPFSFAVKSMRNAEPVIDNKQSFAAQFLTVFSVEVHAISNSTPDPSRDAIACIILSTMCCRDVSFNNPVDTVVMISKEAASDTTSNLFLPRCTSLGSLTVEMLDSELSLIAHFLDEIERLDPDILCGYEVEKASIGYITKRAVALEIGNAIARLGRIIPVQQTATTMPPEQENRHFNYSSAKGRVIFALWRLLRRELEHVQSYSFESSAFQVLHRRMPKFDNGLLSLWFRKAATRPRTILYYIERAMANLQMLVRCNLLSRTSELARLYGILYYDVLSRGSQYRVEAVLLRLAKRLNFISVSPSAQQRAQQCAPECIALTLEPISNYYKSPVIVLDFQSLYPSIMIAYNYSFDTCLGRLERLAKGGPQHLGCFPAGYEVPPSVLGNLSAEHDINISPNGVVFVKRHIRRGLLSAIVEDLLNSRLMVKASMKLYKDDPATTKLLDARQLGLKLLSNVTYGYTAANFSGRMPLIEIADAIVRKGREALENAIALVTSKRNEWGGARVIYGDTDSLFVLVPGATMKEAFDVGAKIADAVTQSNPSPIKLKLEKVFSRCILEAKKRYCGFMYESVDQKEPEFLSKGLETMRKDQCGYVANVLEKSIKVLFSTDSNSQVVRYLKKEIKRLETGAVPIPDLLLSREYRGAEAYSAKGSAAAMLLANKRKQVNPLSEPLAGDRVHYMITVDAPGTGIMQTAREPLEIVSNGLRANADYYIRRQLLPALDRALGTAGIDVWRIIASGVQNAPNNVAENHRVRMPTYSRVVAAASSKVITLTQMYTRRHCVVCGTLTTAQAATGRARRGSLYARSHGYFDKLCTTCRTQPASSSVLLSSRAAALERKVEASLKMCQSCCRFQPIINTIDLHGCFASSDRQEFFACCSTDCPTFYDQYNRDSLLAAARECRDLLASFESCRVTISVSDDES